MEVDWNPPCEIVPTAKPEDARSVPFSFRWQEADFLNAVGLNLLWDCKIILSGLCQALLACGVPLAWPSLAEAQAEERQCAMFIAMSTDYFESFAPYGCLVTLMNLQTAWGACWRQRESRVGFDGFELASWLQRRGNDFIAHFSNFRMQIPGLAWSADRLAGGPIIPPNLANEEEDSAATNVKIREQDDAAGLEDDTESAFQRSVKNMMLASGEGSKVNATFKASLKNMVLAMENANMQSWNETGSEDELLSY
jgi:hypothetical protein